MGPVQCFQEAAGDGVSGVDCVISEVGPNVSLLWGKRLGPVEAMPSGVAGEAAEASDYGVGGLVRDCRAYTRVALSWMKSIWCLSLMQSCAKVKAIGQFWTKAVSWRMAVARLSFWWADVSE